MFLSLPLVWHYTCWYVVCVHVFPLRNWQSWENLICWYFIQEYQLSLPRYFKCKICSIIWKMKIFNSIKWNYILDIILFMQSLLGQWPLLRYLWCNITHGTGFIAVREMSGRNKFYQGQGIVREFYQVSGKFCHLTKLMKNVMEFHIMSGKITILDNMTFQSPLIWTN